MFKDPDSVVLLSWNDLLAALYLNSYLQKSHLRALDVIG